jgi:hypothetical protein
MEEAMEINTAQATPELVNVTFTDWEGMRRVSLEDVARNATVAELLDEVRRAMDLPNDTSYQALLDGRELNQMETLEEAGIVSEAEMEIIPEVHAGR